MTSKLKCPVCQQDLGIILCDTDDFICNKCRMCGSEKLWKALIQAKRDLEIIRKTLLTVYARGFTKSEAVGILQRNNMTINKALEQIEHKG